MHKTFFYLKYITTKAEYSSLNYNTQKINYRRLIEVLFLYQAILCYWVSTNIFSLVQVSLLRLPKVRTYFEIPIMVKHDINKLPATKKKFVQGFKDCKFFF